MKSYAEMVGIRGLEAWIDSAIKKIGASWHVHDIWLNGFRLCHEDGRVAIVTGDVELDGKRWIHFSCSMPGRMPTWTELVQTKEELLGKESLAIQVIPPRSKYVNKDPRVLHFFLPVGHEPIPDFTRGRGCI